MALEHVHTDAVAAAQRPHRPGRECRRRGRDREADEPQVRIEVDRERLRVRHDEWHPHEGRVVLDPPRRVSDEAVRALTPQDAQRSGGQEDEVRREQDRDAQGAVVHLTILGWLERGVESLKLGQSPRCSRAG